MKSLYCKFKEGISWDIITKNQGMACWDILLTTQKGQEEGNLPKGVVILTGFQYADPDYRNWMKEIESSGRYSVSVAKHCDDENELTHLSKMDM